MFKKYSFFFFLLSISSGFSQNLDDKIYDAVEVFNETTNSNKLSVLREQETRFIKQLDTKNDYLAYVYLLCNKAYFLKNNRQIENAIANYELADKTFFKQELHKVSEYDIIEYCLKPLGNLYTKGGNFTNAEHTINKYIVLATKQQNTNQVTSGKINLAKLLQTLNKHKSVVRITEKTLRTKGLSKQYQQKLEAIKQTSLFALQEDTSLDFLTDNIPLSNNQLLFKNHQQKSLQALQKNDFSKALIELLKSEKYLNYQSDYEPRDKAKFYIELAKLQILNTKVSDGEISLEYALNLLQPNRKKEELPSIKELYAENTFIDIFDLYASIQPNITRALQYYDLSFYTSDLLLKNIQNQHTKIVHQAARKNRSEKCISLLYSEFVKTKENIHIERAFIYAEKNKASVLQNAIEKQEQHTKIFSVAKLQDKLATDKAIMNSYFYGNTAIYQFVITSSSSTFQKLNLSENFKEDLNTFLHFFDTPNKINDNIENYTNLSNRLYISLGIVKNPKTSNLIIVPDGLLHFLPFEALLTTKTSTTNYTKMPFLMQQITISYTRNSNAYIANKIIPKTPNVLGIFPVFKNTTKELTYSLEEADAIKKTVKTLLVKNKKATKEFFVKNCNSYNILHLSTHANGGDFNNSATLDFYNGTMSVEELYPLKMNPDLVVLSACETGVGKVLKGEGAMSIARGFQYAGAKNILFSLWKVNDLATSKLIQSFYKSYNKNYTAAVANRHAKLDYLRDTNISNAKKSPYYWASFVYYGSNFEKRKKDNCSFIKQVLILSILSFFLIFLFLRIRNKYNG